MKYLLTLILTGLFSFAALAQSNYQPGNNNVQAVVLTKDALVYDPSLMLYSAAEVSQQNSRAEQFWKNTVYYDQSNSDAWLNYYKAIRFRAQALDQEKQFRSKLDSVDTEMGKNVAGTWQQLFVHYWNGNHDLSRTASLEQAYKIQKYDGDLLRQLVANKLISGDKKLAGEYAKSWMATGQASVAYSNYAYNVLQSVALNCILLTNGEFDTYPILQQQASGVRSDVGILNISLSAKPANRARMFRNLGLVLPQNDSIAPFDAAYIRRVAAANPGKKIYLASTVSAKLLSDMQNELFITGLAFRFSTDKPVDNLNFLRDNVGTLMNASYYAILSTESRQIVKLKMNYVLPLAIAAKQYELAGNKNKAEQLRTAALKIGTANGKYDEVNAIISSQ